MITFKINDSTVKANKDWTILETARHYKFDIPTLCFHEAVSAGGSCRLCMVEIRDNEWSKLVASCMYKVREGLNVYTDSVKVKNVRKWLFEMLLSEYPESKELDKIAKKNGVLTSRFRLKETKEKCFLCGLCVRVCSEISRVSAISIVNRGVHKEVGAPFLSSSETCIECGRCVTICPTEAMSEKISGIRGNKEL